MAPPNQASGAPTLNPATTSQHGNEQRLKCPFCSYTPTGDAKWKFSNMTRHVRTQHTEKGSLNSENAMNDITERATETQDKAADFAYANVLQTARPSRQQQPVRNTKEQQYTEDEDAVDDGDSDAEDGDKKATKRKHDDAFEGSAEHSQSMQNESEDGIDLEENEAGNRETEFDGAEENTDWDSEDQDTDEDDGSGRNGHPAFAERSQLASEPLPPYAINPRYWGKWVDYGIPEWALTGGRFPAE